MNLMKQSSAFFALRWINIDWLVKSQTTGDRTGLATGSSLYKKNVLRNWLVYVILSKTT